MRAFIAAVLLSGCASSALAQRTLSCPTSQSAVTDGTYAVLNYPTAAVSGNPTPITTSYGPNNSQKPGSKFSVGLTKVVVTARWKNGQTLQCSFDVTVTSATVPPPPPPPAPIDCVLSPFVFQSATTWTACDATGHQTRTETWTRTVLTPAANGGQACGPLAEQRTVTQACAVPPPPPPPPPETKTCPDGTVIPAIETCPVQPPPPPPPGNLSVPLTIQEALYPGSMPGLARVNEPVTVGIPLPDSDTGGATDVAQLGLSGASVGQFRALGRWPSGRLKWVLVDTQASTGAVPVMTNGAGNFGGPDLASDQGATISVSTGAALFTVRKAKFNNIDTAVVGNTAILLGGISQGFVVVGPAPGQTTCPCLTVYASSNDAGSTAVIEENGPARAVIKAMGVHRDGGGNAYMGFTVRLTFYKNKSTVKVTSTLRNADYGPSNSFATAYKGHQGYELRLTPTLVGTPTYTIATHATPAVGTLGASDSVYLYQGESSLMKFQDWCGFQCVPYSTDTGYQVVKNGATVASGTNTQYPQGWADIKDANGAGLTIGAYQLAAYWPKSLEFNAGGSDVRIGIWPRQNSQPYYQAWPQHSTHDLYLNFHGAAPAPADDFLRFQHPLLARAPYAYYNATGVFPWTLIDPAVEDAFYANVRASATPPLNAGSEGPIRDVGTTNGQWALNIYRWYGWNGGGGSNQQEFRWSRLLNFITRGMTGRYLDSVHFYRWLSEQGEPRSDGFNWRDKAGETDGFGRPSAASANSTLAHRNWRDQEHGHWYGMGDYYFMSGDEGIKDAILDGFLDWFASSPTTYQQGTIGGRNWTVNTADTSLSAIGGAPFTAAEQYPGKSVAINGEVYYIAGRVSDTALTLTTSAGTQTGVTMYSEGGLFNTRAVGVQLMGAGRLGRFLADIGDATNSAIVFRSGERIYQMMVLGEQCINGQPAPCDIGTIDGGSFRSLGVNRARGAHWGASGTTGNWCGVPHAYRSPSAFQTSILTAGLLEYRAARGPSWSDYDRSLDFAYGLSQFALNELNVFTTGNWQTDGFRFSVALDVPNDCQAPTDLWTVSTNGTAVTNVGAKPFVTNGNWTSSYQFLGDGTPAFTINGVPHAIASVSDSTHLTLTTTAGIQSNATAAFSEQNFAPTNNQTVWAPFLATHEETGAVDWLPRTKVAMQKLMAALGATTSDWGSYYLSDLIYRLGTARPTLASVPLSAAVDNGGGSYTLSWTVPVGAMRYRIKWSPKRIVDWIGFDPGKNVFVGDPTATVNWFAASNVPVLPAPGTAGTVQSLTVQTGLSGLTASNFSIKAYVMAGGGGGGGDTPVPVGGITAIEWTKQPETTGWPGNNGYHEGVYDPVSQQSFFYTNTPLSSSIYSTDFYAYASISNIWTHLGGTGHLGGDCTDTWPAWPPDRHPVGQMAIDTTRKRLWMVGGVCQNVVRADLYYRTLTADPVAGAWTKVAPATLPVARTSSGLIYSPDDDVLFLFGSDTGPQTHDNWVYCPATSTLTAKQVAAGCLVPNDWAEVRVAGGVQPPGVQFPRLHYDTVHRKVLAYGGATGGGIVTAETWAYDIPTRTWTQKARAGLVPPVYTGSASPPTYALAFVPSAGQLVYRQTFNAGAPQDWRYDYVTDTWAAIASTGIGPPAGADALAVYDVAAARVVAYARDPTTGKTYIWQAVFR